MKTFPAATDHPQVAHRLYQAFSRVIYERPNEKDRKNNAVKAKVREKSVHDSKVMKSVVDRSKDILELVVVSAGLSSKQEPT